MIPFAATSVALLALPSLAAAAPQLGTSYCSSLPNATGSISELGVTGSPRVEDNSLVLEASSLPAFSFGYFLVSQQAGQVVMPAGSAGVLCLGGAVGRYSQNVLQADASGLVALSLDLTSIPHPTQAYSLESGDSLYFQYWFRDTSPTGAPTSNFSSGARVDFACSAVEFQTVAPVFALPRIVEAPAAADLNGDGLTDLVSVSRAQRTIEVLFNLGDAEFAAPVASPGLPSGQLNGLAPVDVDHDGDLDLLGVGGSELGVFLNDGTGQFTLFATQSISTTGFSVQTSDLDQDGWVDAVIPRGAGLVSTVFMGPGGVPSLAGQVNAGIPVGQTFVADIDGDALEDLVVTNGFNGDFVWLRNLGNRFFAAMPPLPSLGGVGYRTHLLDIDADGDQDLAYWRDFPAEDGSFLNDGSGAFTLGTGLGLPGNAFTAETVDFDGDGDDDVLLGNIDGDRLTVGIQTAPGAFDDSLSFDSPFPIRYWELSDLDGDGEPDIAAQDIIVPADGLAVLKNSGGGSFASTIPITLDGTRLGPVAADWNGDGREDVLYGSGSGIEWIENVGDAASLGAAVIPGADGAMFRTPFAVLDLDADGDLDIVAQRPGGALQSLVNDGSGTVVPRPVTQLSGVVAEAFLADVTGDGLPDIVNVHVSNGVTRAQVARGAGDGSFTSHANVTLSGSPRGAVSGDVDGDGDEDLILACVSPQEIRVFLNGGSGDAFTLDSTLPAVQGFSGTALSPLALDLDLDGDIDLAVRSDELGAGSQLLRVFLNGGSGNFLPSVAYAAGVEADRAVVYDVNQDTYPDLVLTGAPTPVWSVLLNDGAGAFLPPMKWLGIDGMTGALPIDINFDGRPDMLSFRPSPAAMGVHPGSCN